ncbi:MAG: hypothetical protein QXK37_02230 [Candidatus Woesearchaeota archaeon]
MIWLFFILLAGCSLHSPTGYIVKDLEALGSAEASCGVGVDLIVLEKGGVEQICYNKKSKFIEFTLLNQVNNPIKSISLEVYTNSGVYPIDRVQSADERHVVFKGKAYYDEEKYGLINSVFFSPEVIIDNQTYICKDSLHVQQIEPCID